MFEANRRLLLRLAICAGLVAITWAVFGPTLYNKFVNYDDNAYVYENPHVMQGLSFANVVWAFTHFDANNWHPLTTTSHMLDYQLFGLKPAGHHFTNVLLHTVAVISLFLLLDSTTGAAWTSAFVAALFAIHPLHVESVAWIAERKDVLSAVFFMLTLAAYVHYARKPSVLRYVNVTIAFVFGLMSKPMLVTTPVVLLLIDYWPLNRGQRSEVSGQRPAFRNLVLEKVPLFLLSIASSVTTFLAQSKTAVVPLRELPFFWRITNAVEASVTYVWQMLWPAKLALFYPFPAHFELSNAIGAVAVLVAITVCVFVLRKRCPFLVTGWSWYLVMLLPVIGLIQVSSQSHADRYTYLPQIGLAIMAAWGIADLTRSLRHQRAIVGALAVCLLIACACVARAQTTYWYDSETIWKRTLAVTNSQNDIAHLFLGKFLLQERRFDDAIPEYRAFLSRNPKDADAHSDLAFALTSKGDMTEAVTESSRAVAMDPANSAAETTLANFLLEHGQLAEAVAHYRNVVRQHPESALAHYNLAVGLHREGDLAEAIVHYKEALRIEPGYPDAERLLGTALLQSGQRDEAEKYLNKD